MKIAVYSFVVKIEGTSVKVTVSGVRNKADSRGMCVAQRKKDGYILSYHCFSGYFPTRGEATRSIRDTCKFELERLDFERDVAKRHGIK